MVGKKLQINLSNRLYYTLILIGILIVGVWGVFALTPGVKPNPGHSLNELTPPAGCTGGQVLSWNGSSLICADDQVGSGSGGMTLGNWETRSINIVYQAATDGFAVANTECGTTNIWIEGFTDANNPPTTKRIEDLSDTSGVTAHASITMPVKKNDYWYVDTNCNGLGEYILQWIPIISGIEGSNKVCDPVDSPNFNSPLLVPSSWTPATCNSFRAGIGASDYQLGCIFENSFSLGGLGGGIPSPNCGW